MLAKEERPPRLAPGGAPGPAPGCGGGAETAVAVIPPPWPGPTRARLRLLAHCLLALTRSRARPPSFALACRPGLTPGAPSVRACCARCRAGAGFSLRSCAAPSRARLGPLSGPLRVAGGAASRLLRMFDAFSSCRARVDVVGCFLPPFGWRRGLRGGRLRLGRPFAAVLAAPQPPSASFSTSDRSRASAAASR